MNRRETHRLIRVDVHANDGDRVLCEYHLIQCTTRLQCRESHMPIAVLEFFRQYPLFPVISSPSATGTSAYSCDDGGGLWRPVAACMCASSRAPRRAQCCGPGYGDRWICDTCGCPRSCACGAPGSYVNSIRFAIKHGAPVVKKETIRSGPVAAAQYNGTVFR